MRRSLMALTALPLVLVACGNGSGNNDADVAFAQEMVPHHEQAIVMSELASTRASSPEVKELAVQIKDAQDPEIEEMNGWLEDWGEDPAGGMEGMEGMGEMEGMLSGSELEELEGASGPEFDRLFLEGMIGHHEGAVTMAERELKEGSSDDAQELAGDIIETQQAEIEQMKDLLAR